jgi:hypothetical protein
MSFAFLEALSMALRLEEFSVYLDYSLDNLPSIDFASMSLYQRSEDGVGEGEFSKVFGKIVLHLICLEALYTRLFRTRCEKKTTYRSLSGPLHPGPRRQRLRS